MTTDDLTAREKELARKAFSIAGKMGGHSGVGSKKRRPKSHYQRIGRQGAQKRHGKKAT